MISFTSKPTPKTIQQMTRDLKEKTNCSVCIKVVVWTFNHLDKSSQDEIKYAISILYEKLDQREFDSFQDLLTYYFSVMEETSELSADLESLLDAKADDKFHALKDEGKL